MSLFKKMVHKDVHNVFINLDEFAECHSINDFRVNCIIDKADISSASHQGVFQNVLTIYVRSCDFEPMPVEGETLYLDEEMFFVQTVSDEDGVLVITCRAYEQ